MSTQPPPPDDRESPDAAGEPPEAAGAPPDAAGEPLDHEHGRVGRIVHPAEPVVGRVASALGSAVDVAVARWGERPGGRVRRLRRLARAPLRSLFDEFPEARRANPRERGLRPLPVDEIVGTAVGGGAQRGADFLPLKPFRGDNWASRWQRLRSAVDRLATLPPIDVYRYADGYWVIDGHNRMAAALYAGQVEIDANVIELIPPSGIGVEEPGSLAASLTGSRSLRAAGEGRPANATRDEVDDAIVREPDESRGDPEDSG